MRGDIRRHSNDKWSFYFDSYRWVHWDKNNVFLDSLDLNSLLVHGGFWVMFSFENSALNLTWEIWELDLQMLSKNNLTSLMNTQLFFLKCCSFFGYNIFRWINHKDYLDFLIFHRRDLTTESKPHRTPSLYQFVLHKKVLWLYIWLLWYYFHILFSHKYNYIYIQFSSKIILLEHCQFLYKNCK